MKLFIITAIILTTILFSQTALAQTVITVNPNHVNATLNTSTSATLNWQFTGWDSTCEFKNISWNQGTGKEQNSFETVNDKGAGNLSIFGWHIFDIQLLATCDTTSYQFGPFDITIEDITPPAPLSSSPFEQNVLIYSVIIIGITIAFIVAYVKKK